MRFTQVKLARDQLVLFRERLDRAVDVARDVRLVDALEEALQVRGDFRWLVEGRRIDHSSVVVARVVWGSCSATPHRVAERLGDISEPAADFAKRLTGTARLDGPSDPQGA
jgi:hypothetical protein